MYSIGEFASFGRVSVRMLRHYHALGLLVPARVDEATGYRAYTVVQLTTLSRIVELKELGLRLEDVAQVLQGDGMNREALLEAARADLTRRLAEDSARLARIDAELRRTRGEDIMPTSDSIAVEIRPVEAQRIATLTRPAPGFGNDSIGPVVGPMFPEVAGILGGAGVAGFGPAIAMYRAVEEGIEVTAGFVVPTGTAEIPGVTVSTLPAVAQAATTVHRGSMETIGGSWMALTEWVAEHGHAPSDIGREIYWTPGDRPQEEWVTDLVQPI